MTGLPPAASATSICRSTIGGNLQLTSSMAAVSIGDNPPCGGGNTIMGNAQIVGNKVLVRIPSNTIKAILQYASNTPAPTGGANTAAMKTGQCAVL